LANDFLNDIFDEDIGEVEEPVEEDIMEEGAYMQLLDLDDGEMDILAELVYPSFKRLLAN